MLRWLIEFCVRQPYLTLICALAVAAIGGYCATIVPIDAIPNVGENQVIVFTEWPADRLKMSKIRSPTPFRWRY